MKALVSLALLWFAHGAFALGPEEYRTLNELAHTDFYRLTCSSVPAAGKSQVHLHLAIERGIVREANLITLYPAKAMHTIPWNPGRLDALLAIPHLTVEGEQPGAYWRETFELEVLDGPRGLHGHFKYDDGDGMTLDRDVNCGALNHIRN